MGLNIILWFFIFNVLILLLSDKPSPSSSLVTFNVYTAEYANANELNELLDKPDGTNTIISTKADALNLADDLLKKSQYVKFALKNISNTSAKAQLVDRVLGYHDIRNANEQMYGVNGQDIDAAAPYATGSGIRGEGALTPINGYLNLFRIDNYF